MGLFAFFEIIPPGLLNSASIFENHSQISSPGFRLLLALPTESPAALSLGYGFLSPW